MAGNDPFEGLALVSSFTVTSTSVEDGKPLPAAQMSGMLGVPGGCSGRRTRRRPQRRSLSWNRR
jgi:hypothetical protein